jgi:hypothetical protein
MRTPRHAGARAALLIPLLLAARGPEALGQPAEEADAPRLGVLAPANLAAPRPAPPFDLTGTWQHEFTGWDSWRFVPEEFELTPEAQRHYEAGRRAQAEGRLYRDDIGQCWPAGMPLIMTRVWPLDMIQLPTVIYMISHFMNSLRVVYLDGRTHSDPDIVVPAWNGESIGRWEDDALIVDTRYFPGHHHWIDQGGASIPASDELRIIERIRMVDDDTLEIAYTMSDPKSWVGEWQSTKVFKRHHDVDIVEVGCLPDLNENLPATSSQSLVQ